MGSIQTVTVSAAKTTAQRQQTCRPIGLCRARTRTMPLSWHFLSSSGRSPILDQAVDDLPARDPAGHIGRSAGPVNVARSLFVRLVRAMFVVMPRVLGQGPPEVPVAVDQQVVKVLAP